jgi:hypothetical protein
LGTDEHPFTKKRRVNGRRIFNLAFDFLAAEFIGVEWSILLNP